MASGLSYSFSSPPHPTSNPWSRSTTVFFTPQQPVKQQHWAGAFAPTSPSPLRTSRNANLMSSHSSGGNADSYGFGKHVAQDHDTENASISIPAAVAQPSCATPFPQHQLQNNSAVGTTSSFTTFNLPATASANTNTSTFSFGAAISASDESASALSTSTHRDLFQFSSRARSSSPSALLQSHTRDARDSRKRLFLDRLRSRRDDGRAGRTNDQVLRMDFMKERRRWEAEMERERAATCGDVDVDADADAYLAVQQGNEMNGPEVDDDLSPTEEKEIEELASKYYLLEREREQEMEMQSQPTRDAVVRREDAGMDGIDEEFSDDGYDEVFMEVLSQQSSAEHSHARNETVMSLSMHNLDQGFAERNKEVAQETSFADSAMDMS